MTKSYPRPSLVHTLAPRADSPRTGIRRQPGNPVPRDVGQERQQRRAGFLDDGAPDQGADGHDGDKQHQAQRQRLGRPRCLQLTKRRLLLSDQNLALLVGLVELVRPEGTDSQGFGRI